MEVSGTADVVVGLGQGGGKRDWFRQLIAVAFQDGLDLFEAVEALAIGQGASTIQALGWIRPPEIEQSQTNPVSLFGMGFGLKARGDPDQTIGADIFGPVFYSPRGPLLVFSMPFGHMAGLSGEAGTIVARMGSDRLMLEIQGDQAI